MIAFQKSKPFNHLHDAEGDEDSIPGPKDQIDLVDDDIEGKDAEGIQLALAPCRPVLIVVAAGHLGPKQSDIQYVLLRVRVVPEGRPRTSGCTGRRACSPLAVS